VGGVHGFLCLARVYAFLNELKALLEKRKGYYVPEEIEKLTM